MTDAPKDGKDAPAPTTVQGEHFFAASYLEPLAVKWKELNAKGKHTEAMLVLEEIVVGSTQMFKRLAQHEHYHYTVDLDILVSAAQEKVVKWLLRWQRKKGRLFTWFCVDGRTPILLEDGSCCPIRDLENYTGKVMCWNTEKKQFEASQVTGWGRTPANRKEWRQLIITTSAGFHQPVLITKDHPVWTQNGWKPVTDLLDTDILYVNEPKLSQLQPIQHKKHAKKGQCYWKIQKMFRAIDIAGHTKDCLEWKYDLTVENNHNFLAGRCKLLVHNSKCSKNAFRSELVKVNQFRKRYHVTSDNLEKFYPSEEHPLDREDLIAETRAHLANLTCRWGNPQEIGAIHFLIECILEDDHEKQAAIKGAAYAYGISIELSKFFYAQALIMLRDQMYKRVRVPYTEEDLVRLAFSYTDFVSFFDTPNSPLTWNGHGKWMVTVHGGKRVKIPTVAQIQAVKEAKQIFDEIDAGDKDPDSVAEVAAKHGKNTRTAQEIFNEMSENLDPRRSGEYEVYHDDPTHPS